MKPFSNIKYFGEIVTMISSIIFYFKKSHILKDILFIHWFGKSKEYFCNFFLLWFTQKIIHTKLLIIITLYRLQFEQLAFTWMERQKLGGSYSSHRAQSEKHVVVCSTTLQADTIMDFLNEFYAHPLLQVRWWTNYVLWILYSLCTKDDLWFPKNFPSNFIIFKMW